MMTDELFHYGMPRRSGRYPWGSGKNPYQGYQEIYSRYQQQIDEGLTAQEVAKAMGLSSREQLDNLRQLANKEKTIENIYTAKSYSDKGMSNVAIGKKMGVGEATVRRWLKEDALQKETVIADLATMFADKVDKEHYLDVGKYTELDMGITDGRKKAVLQFLKDHGYIVHDVKVPQLTNPNQKTSLLLLCPPDTEWKDAKNNLHKVTQFSDKVDYGENGKPQLVKTQKPKSVDSSRIGVRYADEGGTDKDGVIELRRGVADLTMGDAAYAQVRIAVDGTHYIKGMAIYSDNLPKGVDILINSNKKKGTPLTDPDPDAKQILKPMKDNPENPFGALIKAGGQTTYVDENGKQQLSVVNKIREEGDWDNYSKSLSAQMLSKQPKPLVDKQLRLAYAEKAETFDEIKNLTNPAIKRKLLGEFADECDSAATHMKAAALPRQTTKVLLPVPELKDNEIYAPTLRPGEKVVLIRYPHAGTFEIPQLTVVNPDFKPGKNTVGKKSLDAVGINPSAAAQLSGADFDGDTALVIPVNSKVKIKTSPALEQLKGFDPKEAFPGYPGMKKMTHDGTQKQMGIITNLLTDMQLGGVDNLDDLACAVKHSMVVIDAEKHGLDYKTSERVNRIAELKAKYRPPNPETGKPEGGAATIVSRSKAKVYVDQRKQISPTRDWDPETGEVHVQLTGEKNKSGGLKQQQISRMMTVKDANELVSAFRNPIEISYANYANSMKAMANEARKEYLKVKNTEYNKDAALKYAKEIESLDTKLFIAEKNRPRERKAQALATSEYKAILSENQDMDKDDKDKERQRCLTNARAAVGASKKDVEIQITDREWEAIQAGALRPSKVQKILNNTDSDKFKERALPRNQRGFTDAQLATIKAMFNGNFTLQQIADKYGVSPSAISKALKS